MSQPAKTLKDFIVGLRHVGHIVPDLRAAVASFKRVYGVADKDIDIVPPYAESTQTRFAFIRVGGAEFELIEPVSAAFKKLLGASPTAGGGLNHVAYTVRDIEGALVHLKKSGVLPGHVTPDGIIDLGAKKMVYLDPDTTDGLLIELIEDKDA